MMKLWSIEAQNERRLELAAFLRGKLRSFVGDDARAPHLIWWDQARVAIWASNAFFLGDAKEIAFANTILRYVREDLSPVLTGPSVFECSALASVLSCHGRLLEVDVLEFVLRFLDKALPAGTTRDYQFHGYNDNMPVMWTWALAVGGPGLNDPRYTEMAWANLRQLKDLLRRRGTVAEYGVGYGTHRLTSIAHLAQHAPEAEMRVLARDIEARLWAELAGHWHPQLAQICGASMRGGPPIQSETPTLLRQVFGDQIAPRNWKRSYEESSRQTAIDLGLDPAKFLFAYPFGYGAEFASAEYHVPDAVAELFYRKPPGFTFQCTAEVGYVNNGIFRKMKSVYGAGGAEITREFTDEVIVIQNSPAHGAQPHGLTTYHGRHYAVGSSTAAMFTASHPFRCTYRRPDGTLGDVVVRYNTNDKIAGGRLKNKYWKSPEYSEEKENYNQLYFDQGAHHCLQYGNTVLCLQVPHYDEYWDVRSMRTDIFFHQGQGKVRRIEQDGELILVDEGSVFVAIHPLIGRHGKRKQAIKIHEQGEWLVVSLYNYEGPSLQFTQHEIAKLGNGFVFEVRDATDYGSFADFQAEMKQARIIDQLYSGRRRVHYARADLRLSTHYCPYTQTTMYDAVNGLTHEIPQFAYSDGRHRDLPFLDGKPAPGFEDWDWIQTQIERQAETYNPID